LTEEKIGEMAIKCYKNFVENRKLENTDEPDEERENTATPDVTTFIELKTVYQSASSDVFFQFL
jgi:hypothetical protein